eukprot:gnl/TRDRNA2_/TRDRNA2_153605_c2_seq1.p1 gnl/TRDRNA2_/TRDRNA2_153605_c2~~gnl/TRDRNA2_/TRDRNA2_153605_c2_seq1.p1  ORF type:complete len:298 (+),score=29.28 gnl/TRDRNA2_/TRDRNA2_153605_c2_seq1:100-894(+)
MTSTAPVSLPAGAATPNGSNMNGFTRSDNAAAAKDSSARQASPFSKVKASIGSGLGAWRSPAGSSEVASLLSGTMPSPPQLSPLLSGNARHQDSIDGGAASLFPLAGLSTSPRLLPGAIGLSGISLTPLSSPGTSLSITPGGGGGSIGSSIASNAGSLSGTGPASNPRVSSQYATGSIVAANNAPQSHYDMADRQSSPAGLRSFSFRGTSSPQKPQFAAASLSTTGHLPSMSSAPPGMANATLSGIARPGQGFTPTATPSPHRR